MKHLIIGLDIDGVIVDYAQVVLPMLSQICERDISLTEITHRDLGVALHLDNKTVADFWNKLLSSDKLLNAPPIEGAISGLSQIKQHEIIFVTGRPIKLKNLTLSWLNKYNIKYDHIIFEKNGRKANTGHKFDVFVEDFLDEAAPIAESGVVTLLMNQPWNQTPSLPKNCLRVYDWNEIVNYINGL